MRTFISCLLFALVTAFLVPTSASAQIGDECVTGLGIGRDEQRRSVAVNLYEVGADDGARTAAQTREPHNTGSLGDALRDVVEIPQRRIVANRFIHAVRRTPRAPQSLRGVRCTQ